MKAQAAREILGLPMNCKPNERYEKCGNKCELKCGEEEEDLPMDCRGRACPGPPARVCDQGFYRDPVIGDCVPEEECDQHTIVTFKPCEYEAFHKPAPCGPIKKQILQRPNTVLRFQSSQRNIAG
ncbi:trypsin Inhibitor like cysteine rich domain protein [Ancylostoma duodenale]|uniref:Trypsin Inhibitor like cysteine rich domain protein n=1 Tax=Ancylostoma duodenale TaxID=51022 RepID=A0A0C2H4C6_9BILA|nr:trypsin Inhibitor like cysteine rich domain protein [Ancylostoma duodenale]